MGGPGGTSVGCVSSEFSLFFAHQVQDGLNVEIVMIWVPRVPEQLPPPGKIQVIQYCRSSEGNSLRRIVFADIC